MALTTGSRNTYEEVPDLAKKLINEAPAETGQRPKSKVSRDTLVRTHQRHLKLLSEGSVPIRSLILPKPYPPARGSIHTNSKKTVHLGDLQIDSRDRDALLLLRTITSPYVWSSTVTVAEDETGDVARLTVCNLEDNVVDPIVTEGSIVAIRQPCWTRLVDGGYHICVDHPSDLVLLRAEDDLIPESWRDETDSDQRNEATQCKKDGDMMFLKKRFRKALELYTQGLRLSNRDSDPVSEIDFYRKRCGVNIVLLRLDDAANDLSKAIATHARSTPNLSSSELANASIVEGWLHNRSTEDPLQISSKITRPLKELAARIKFDIGINQSRPDYNLPVISSRWISCIKASLRKEFFDLEDGGYWDELGWDLAEGEDIPVDVFRVEYIRRFNCYSAPTRSSDLLNQPPNTNPELRTGFWTHASYMNHSCLPNTIRTFIGDIRFLRAARDIAAGEELTNQYIAPDIDITERQEKLKTMWGFECDCQLCILDGSVNENMRQERMKRFEELKGMVMQLGEKGPPTITSLKKVARALRELEALYSPSMSDGEEGEDRYAALPRLGLVHPTLFLTEAWRSVKNVDRTIEYALKLLRNFGIIVTTEGKELKVEHKAGLVNVETVRALNYLAEAYTSRGEEQLAKQCLEKAKVWYIVITGAEVGMEQFFAGSS
ncbi:hypothetical protein SLS60_009536 [Paraconiothyrium brasiliense]|uniref:SET domain-containing protein n=1 Tax=Paraconiothyrium brasiliense TaxID=300254 RepID=A0ABR3QUN8_9PLEO